MYQYYNNMHICDNLSLIPELKEKDKILFISKENFISQLILEEILFDNMLYRFREIETTLPMYYNIQKSVSDIEHNKGYQNDTYMIKINEKFYYLSYDMYQNIINDNIFNDYTYKILSLITYNNKIEFIKNYSYDKNNQYDFYLKIPIGKNYLILEISENYNMIYFTNGNETSIFRCNVIDLFKLMKLDMNIKEIKDFNDICDLYAYDIIEYKKDNGKQLVKIKKIIKDNNINENFLNRYKLCFEYKPLHITGYYINQTAYIFKNDKLIHNNNYQRKQNICSGYIKTYNLNSSEELQDIYYIAKDMIYFTKHNKHGFNPEDGLFYDHIDGKASKILYWDAISIISEAHNRIYYCIKKYGYYIETYDKERDELIDRYEVFKKLTGK